jgi:RHS repeat-associated protein
VGAPFGNPRGTVPTWPTNHGYLNAPTDPIGLTHLGAREYDPTTGRFASVDPVLSPADPIQMNGYAYADSDPTTASDADGLKAWYQCPDGDCTGNGYGTSSPARNDPPRHVPVASSPPPPPHKSVIGKVISGLNGGLKKAIVDPFVGAYHSAIDTWNQGYANGYAWGSGDISLLEAMKRQFNLFTPWLVAFTPVGLLQFLTDTSNELSASVDAFSKGDIEGGTEHLTMAATNVATVAFGEAGAVKALRVEGAAAKTTTTVKTTTTAAKAGDEGSAASTLRGTNQRGQVTSRASFRKATLQGAWEGATPGASGDRLCPTTSLARTGRYFRIQAWKPSMLRRLSTFPTHSQPSTSPAKPS